MNHPIVITLTGDLTGKATSLRPLFEAAAAQINKSAAEGGEIIEVVVDLTGVSAMGRAEVGLIMGLAHSTVEAGPWFSTISVKAIHGAVGSLLKLARIARMVTELTILGEPSSGSYKAQEMDYTVQS